MAKTNPFDKHPDEYDRWFEEHENIYKSELRALEKLVPDDFDRAIEVGVGTGRFASRLGISEGLEPSEPAAEFARRRGINVIEGQAEDLPLSSSSFDLVLLVTVVCFLDDVDQAFREAYRVLQEGGSILVGFIPKDSRVGKFYRQAKEEDKFFKVANFYSAETVVASLKEAGFESIRSVQTLTNSLEAADEQPEPPREGFGEGSFVVFRGVKR